MSSIRKTLQAKSAGKQVFSGAITDCLWPISGGTHGISNFLQLFSLYKKFRIHNDDHSPAAVCAVLESDSVSAPEKEEGKKIKQLFPGFSGENLLFNDFRLILFHAFS